MDPIDPLASNEHQLIPAHLSPLGVNQPTGADDRKALKGARGTRNDRPKGCQGEDRRQRLHRNSGL
jgi:hypothetical protein